MRVSSKIAVFVLTVLVLATGAGLSSCKKKTQAQLYMEARQRQEAADPAIAQRRKDREAEGQRRKAQQERGAVLEITTAQGTSIDLKPEEFSALLTRDFKGERDHENQGVALKTLFDAKKIEIAPTDEVTIFGKGTRSFSYEEVLKDNLGFVLTRQGAPKLTSANGASRIKLPHVYRVQISKPS